MRVLLDTNILTRLAQATHPRHEPAAAAVAALRQQGHESCIVPQNLYEFWVVATRPVAVNGLGLTVAEAQAELVRLESLFTFLPETPAFVAEWKKLVIAHDCKGKPAHDARLVAAMIVHDIWELVTFNGVDFQRYPGITIRSPEEVATAS